MLVFILILAILATVVTFNTKVWQTKFGLDIHGGVRVVLSADTTDYEKNGKQWTSGDLESVRKILENRVNFSGVSEPVIITKPPKQIIIELPGLKNEQEAIDSLQSTASLQFYLLPQLGNANGSPPAKWAISSSEDPKTHQKIDVLVDATTRQPVPQEELEAEVFSTPPIVTGKDLLPNSRAVIQPGNNNPVIEFEFNSDGSKVFEEVTRGNIGKFLAIFLDKHLLTAPTINGVIPGKGIIEGSFTLESAKALSDLLNAGALPVPLRLEETHKLEATLGREAVQATVKAGILGLSLVLLFMLGYYWLLPGLVADVALVLYGVFSFAMFKLVGVTLTLPGIAGFILSIGMAVDANILIFERLKEELRAGKTLRPAIEAGFKRAFTAIFDSNVCTIITCFVLYNLGTGPIRGFALTLGMGVAISMFTAITVTRTFLFALVNVFGVQDPKLFGLRFKWVPEWHVMSRPALWLGFSSIIIVPGLIFWGMGGIKKSIDFQGGTELVVPFAARHSADDIEHVIVSLDRKYKDSRVVVTSDPGAADHTAYVTMPTLSTPARLQVIDALTSRVGPLSPGHNVQYSTESGTISSELTLNAIEAVIIASILIVLYLAVRFAIGGFVEGLKYGTCAVIALLHDVLVLWGSFAILGYLFNWQIDSLFVTAMLTVIGFSVHDTIIIFDRIRENLHNRARGETFQDLTDRSINQTIARSVNTSLTVVMTLIALLLLGGGQIRQFSAALLIGIISGTYSSIFNASVLLVLWKKRDAGQAALATPPYAPKVPRESRGTEASGATETLAGDGGSLAGGGTRPARKQPVRRRRM
jgi:SecD/SecF fusion protein